MNHISSHLIGISEHHMRKLEITNLSCNGYELALSCCTEKYSGGGVCILTRSDIYFQTVDLKNFVMGKLLKYV